MSFAFSQKRDRISEKRNTNPKGAKYILGTVLQVSEDKHQGSMKEDASGLQEFDGAAHSSRLFQDGYCSHVNASCDYSSLESVHYSSSQSSASSDVASVSTMSRIVPPATNPGAWSQHSQAGLTCPASCPFSPSSFLVCPAL